MIGFIIFFILSFCSAIYLMRQSNKQAKEITVFCVIALLGCLLWIFIFLGHPINPNRLIGWAIETLGI